MPFVRRGRKATDLFTLKTARLPGSDFKPGFFITQWEEALRAGNTPVEFLVVYEATGLWP